MDGKKPAALGTWPVYQSMTDHDLRAIYEYLTASRTQRQALRGLSLPRSAKKTPGSVTVSRAPGSCLARRRSYRTVSAEAAQRAAAFVSLTIAPPPFAIGRQRKRTHRAPQPDSPPPGKALLQAGAMRRLLPRPRRGALTQAVTRAKGGWGRHVALVLQEPGYPSRMVSAKWLRSSSDSRQKQKARQKAQDDRAALRRKELAQGQRAA